MLTRRKGWLIGGGAATLGAVLLIGAVKPSVSLSILGYTTHSSLFGFSTNHECLFAIIGVSNNRNRSYRYLLDGCTRSTKYSILHKTKNGWKESSEMFRRSAGPLENTLLPAQGFAFLAPVNRDIPCKVAFEFSDSRSPGRIWEWLPLWLRQRIPWISPYHTAVTRVIDERETTVMPAMVRE